MCGIFRSDFSNSQMKSLSWATEGYIVECCCVPAAIGESGWCASGKLLLVDLHLDLYCWEPANSSRGEATLHYITHRLHLTDRETTPKGAAHRWQKKIHPSSLENRVLHKTGRESISQFIKQILACIATWTWISYLICKHAKHYIIQTEYEIHNNKNSNKSG